MASGTQQIKLLEWISRTKPCSLPKGAVAGGFTLEGEETYVARCGNTCGAYIPSKGVASVPYKGIEEFRESFDILVCRNPEIIFWSDSHSRKDVHFSVAIDDEEVVEDEFRHYLLDWERVYITRTRPNTPLTGLKTVTEHRKVKINVDFKHPMLGKYMNNCMHLAYKGKECYLNEYQVLCAYRPPTIQCAMPRPYTWVPASKEHVPENSFVGGKTTDGKNVYLARVREPSRYTPGTKSFTYLGYIIPSMKLCHSFIEYGLQESASYEVLIPLYSSNDLQWSRSQINKYSRTVGVNILCYICRPISGHGIGYFSPYSYIQDEHLMKHMTSFHNYESDSSRTFTTDDQVEILVVQPIPNTLQELSWYAILQSTYGVPRRINELPLPTHLKEYCQLRRKSYLRVL